MPKVSDEHSDARRAQIVRAANLCFAQKGFAETKMSDIFEASGLSAGAVYHYFPSKRALLSAVFDHHTAESQRDSEGLVQVEQTREALREHFISSLRQLDERQLDMRLPMMLHADTLRDPDIAERASRAQRDTVEAFRATVVHLQARGLVDPNLDAEYLCWSVMGLFEGWRVMKLTDPHLSTERFVRVVDVLLAELFGPR